MPQYRYTVLDDKGKKLSGELEAASLEKAAEALRQLDYHILRLSPRSQLFNLEAFLGIKRVRTEDLLMFTLQLCSMLGAGVSLSHSLATLQEEIENTALRTMVVQLLRDLKEGQSFSASLARNPRVFSKVYINMVAAGEVSGNLEKCWENLRCFCKKKWNSSRKLPPLYFILPFSFLLGSWWSFIWWFLCFRTSSASFRRQGFRSRFPP
jgi:type IV pilus assembly protein PilC